MHKHFLIADEQYHLCTNKDEVGNDTCTTCPNNTGNTKNEYDTSVLYEYGWRNQCLPLDCHCPYEARLVRCSLPTAVCECATPRFYGTDPNKCTQATTEMLQKQHKPGVEMTLTGNHKYRIWNEFSFHMLFMKRVVCFYIPEPLVRGYKTHKEFHKYSMKWKFFSDSFYHMLKFTKMQENTVLLSRITYFIAENAPTSERYLWHHKWTAMSQPIKCFRALCHTLIYEIAIFHSINGETCDKSNFGHL